jgi:hypothetical protein
MSDDKFGNFEIQRLMSDFNEATTTASNNLTHTGDASHSDLVSAMQSAFDNAGQDLQNQDKMGNFEIQTLMSDYNEASSMASSVLQHQQSTTNSIIGNIDGGSNDNGHISGPVDGSSHVNDSIVDHLVGITGSDLHGEAEQTKADGGTEAAIGAEVAAVVAVVGAVEGAVGAVEGLEGSFWDHAAEAVNLLLNGNGGSSSWPPLHLDAAGLLPHNSGEPAALEAISLNTAHDIVCATLPASDHDNHPPFAVPELHTDHLNFHL